ncbi:MAG: GNAT family N-acetyltransferase [Fimbriimonas sp.]|nr:GNAT family N-acetyltransferase [Fimbriimonas sp.]
MEKQENSILQDLPEEISGERLLLRPYRAGDGKALLEAVEESREKLQPWRPYEHSQVPPNEDETEAYVCNELTKWMQREYLSMSIWEKETGQYLGGVGLYGIRWDVPSFQIGYWLRSSAEGKGYMTEAARLLCDFSFQTLKAKRVEIRCDTRNVRSAGVPRRLGFVQEETLLSASLTPQGEPIGDFVFSMTLDRYIASNAAALD